MSEQYVFFFDEIEKVEAKVGGMDKVKNLLGGKGGNLAEIARQGIPVPHGFTISTEACTIFYKQDPPALPDSIWDEINAKIKELEAKTEKQFGSEEKPLLVSCRSGARVSMPGMMDTVLNIGLNDVTCQAMINLTQNPRFVWDSYRRLLQGYGAIVMGIPDEKFEEALKQMQTEKEYKSDNDVQAEDWEALVGTYKQIIEEAKGSPFPQDPIDQLKGAIMAVFQSWNSERAIEYRKRFGFSDDWGTAVNVMAMVFGNMGETSASGVTFTRNPSTGENKLWGDFLVNSQGEDVVAGVRTPQHIDQLEQVLPEVYTQLLDIGHKLESFFRDVQDIEFTIENGVLWILQTRNGKKTSKAIIKCNVDLAKEGVITKEEALRRVTSNDIETILHPHFEKADLDAAASKLFTTGVNASPGAGVGQIYFDADKCKEMAAGGQSVILVRQFTKPDDFGGMVVSKGLFTAEGGAASHAAVVARQVGIPAVVGCSQINIDVAAKTVTCGENVLKEGDWVSIDGTSGQVFMDQIPMVDPNLSEQEELLELLNWADEICEQENGRESVNNGPTRGLKVLANADTPQDAEKARQLGAKGIGLCRTEHMFLGDRTQYVQKMVMADNEEERKEAMEELEGMLVEDFTQMFDTMSGLPVIVRLLDPPLHEFLPDMLETVGEIAAAKERAKLEGKDKEADDEDEDEEAKEREKMWANIQKYHETNPMTGFRGVRLCLLIPGLLEMQIRAIVNAVCTVKADEKDPIVEIMVPLVVTEEELKAVKAVMDKEIESVLKEREMKNIHIKYGTMIEVPRAALIADKISEYAEFFSFGTNDLTQLGFGYSRDDAGFIQEYRSRGMFQTNPFQTIDKGIGKLMKIATERGRKTRNDLMVGICGEHGGDPDTIRFCHSIGMDYVSCSPLRIPAARFTAAHAVLDAKK